MSYPIDSDGWRGGAKSYRVCPGCGVKKANTAFRCMSRAGNGRGVGVPADVCIKCQGGYTYTRKPGRPANLQHEAVHLAASRLSFAEWTIRFRPTEDDLQIIARAVERYGKKSPCPDDLLEEYLAGTTQPTRMRIHGQLFHACVLLAHENKLKGRMGSYNIGTRGPGRGAPPNDSERAA